MIGTLPVSGEQKQPSSSLNHIVKTKPRGARNRRLPARAVAAKVFTVTTLHLPFAPVM